MLTGALAPDSGKIVLGVNLQMATLDQSRDSLDPDATLSETLTGGGGDTVIFGDQSKHVVSYMKDFLFSPEQARTPVRVLSGGERGRLTLACALAKASNVLVLDEPTNDLDLETLDVLEEMLGDYKGTVILISHDRDFLDRVVNAVVVPEQGGHWVEYAGGYEDMLMQRGEDIVRKAASAKSTATPKSSASREQKPARRKLTFNEKYALENLPKEIRKLEAKIRALQEKLGDPALFSRDRDAFDEASTALVAAQSALAAAEEQWLAIEIVREEIENG
jgi:ATP-binding cassette subfamily F protein uup